ARRARARSASSCRSTGTCARVSPWTTAGGAANRARAACAPRWNGSPRTRLERGLARRGLDHHFADTARWPRRATAGVPMIDPIRSFFQRNMEMDGNGHAKRAADEAARQSQADQKLHIAACALL